MNELAEKFTKRGHQYEQLCRTKDTAIYLQHINGRQKGYEVIVIRVADKKPARIGGNVRWIECEPYELYPSSEKWGSCGWTYTTEQDARAKYDLINDVSFKLPAPPIYPIRARPVDGFSQERFLTARSINTADASK